MRHILLANIQLAQLKFSTYYHENELKCPGVMVCTSSVFTMVRTSVYQVRICFPLNNFFVTEHKLNSGVYNLHFNGYITSIEYFSNYTHKDPVIPHVDVLFGGDDWICILMVKLPLVVVALYIIGIDHHTFLAGMVSNVGTHENCGEYQR